MKNMMKRLTSCLLALAMMMSMVFVSALQVFAEEEKVASYNNGGYSSLQEALALAQDAYTNSGAKQTVTLTTDLQTEELVVPYGVILDCNSQAVTVTDLLVFGDIVNTGDGGKLRILGTYSISGKDSAMPVYNPLEGSYILCTYTAKSLGVKAKDGSVTFGYSPNFNDAIAYNSVIAGGKLKTYFYLEWTNCEEGLMFACSDELMLQYAQMARSYINAPVNVALQLSVTGLEALGSGADVWVTPVLSNELGVAVSGEPMYYRVPGVKLDIAQTENGSIIADKNYYEVGDAITLTVTPEAGYNLADLQVSTGKQTVDIGSVQLAGGQYSFVAQAEDYTVRAAFAEPVFNATKGDWDLSNQYNGSITINEQVNGSTVYTKANHYQEVSVTVSDAAPTFNEEGKGNFEMQVFFVFDDGMKYQVRLHNTDANGKYKLQNMGGTNAINGWKWLADLTQAQTEKLLRAEGVTFSVKLVGTKVELWVDGVYMASTDIGAQYDGKTAQIGLSMAGNVGVKDIEIPYTLRTPAQATGVRLNIANLADGTLTAEKAAYQTGDTVTLIATPNEGYGLKSLAVKKDGQPVDIGAVKSTGGKYSFVAEAGIYTVEAKFAEPIFSATKGSWDLSDQFNGSITITEQASGSTVITNAGDYEGVEVTVKDYTPSKNADGSLKKGNFSAQLYFIFDNGKEFQVRIHNTDSDGNYKVQTMGESNSFTKYKWRKDLTAAQKAALIDGDGIAFGVKIVGTDAQMYIDGSKVATVALEENGVSYDGSLAQIKLVMNGNIGTKNMQIPFALTKQKEPIAIVTIPAFENGNVTADKENCEMGDVVTLSVSADAGYSQKLYINGQPLLLDWKTNTYTFKTTEEVYSITGSFEPVIDAVAQDESRWDTANQAHGIMNAYYPSNSNAGLLEIKGEYQAVSAIAKNYLAGEDGTGGEGFAVNLGVKFNNGKEFAFRVIKENGKYNCQRFQIGGSDWSKKALDDAAIAAICGDGAEFKVERTAADTLTVSVNGVVYDTYVMEGITEDNWITAVTISHYGHKGQHVAIPYALTEAATTATIAFDSADLSKYVIVYDYRNADYAQLAKQLRSRIAAQYGVTLRVLPDLLTGKKSHEILIGDTNRYSEQGRVMEYSVTVNEGIFKVNVGGSFSGEKAVAYLCENVFNGQDIALRKGEHYHTSLLTNSRAVTKNTSARIMTANVLADAFADKDSYEDANYRAEIFAGMLISYTPDVVGMQEVDSDWDDVLDSYLKKIEKTHGIKYSRCLASYNGKVNYSSMLYRSDKFQVENSGLEAFNWWKDLGANYKYHMRNISWAQFASLADSSEKFVVANTHWSYETEHADGNTYLSGSATPIVADQLRQQCKDETSQYMSVLRGTYPDVPIFLTGDFNTSLSLFTQETDSWTPASFAIISEQAKQAGKALSTVPATGHYDHIFGIGSYTINCYEFFNNVNHHKQLTDHPFAYVDLAF